MKSKYILLVRISCKRSSFAVIIKCKIVVRIIYPRRFKVIHNYTFPCILILNTAGIRIVRLRSFKVFARQSYSSVYDGSLTIVRFVCNRKILASGVLSAKFQCIFLYVNAFSEINNRFRYRRIIILKLTKHISRSRHCGKRLVNCSLTFITAFRRHIKFNRIGFVRFIVFCVNIIWL